MQLACLKTEAKTNPKKTLLLFINYNILKNSNSTPLSLHISNI